MAAGLFSFLTSFSASRNTCTIKWFRTKRRSGQKITEIFGAKVMLRNWYEWPKVLCKLWQKPKLGDKVEREKKGKNWVETYCARWLLRRRKMRHINDYARSRTRPKTASLREGVGNLGIIQSKFFTSRGLIACRPARKKCTNLLNVLVIDLQMSTFVSGSFRKGQRALWEQKVKGT